MQFIWRASRTIVPSRLRLAHAVRGTRRPRQAVPPRFFSRPGLRLVEELAAFRATGLSVREVVAVELGVAETDWLLWGVRSAWDESFLADAIAWGDHGLLAQRWFEVGDALERDRRQRTRRSILERVKSLSRNLVRAVLKHLPLRPALPFAAA